MTGAFDAATYAAMFPPGVERHWWQIARNRIIASEVRRFAGPSDRVLDVGCGLGIATKFIRDAGIDCWGVEIAEVVPRPDISAYVMTGTRAESLPAEFRSAITAITVLDVVEHVEDPREFLESLMEAFPGVRNVLITVPARMELWSNYDVFLGHHRRYSLETIRELGDALGWKQVFAGYFMHSAYVAGRAILFGKHARPVHKKVPGRYTRYLHLLVGWGFILEYRLLPRRVYGSSIIARFEVR